MVIIICKRLKCLNNIANRCRRDVISIDGSGCDSYYLDPDYGTLERIENESGVEADAESRCPECGETEPDLHCANCGHSWYRTA